MSRMYDCTFVHTEYFKHILGRNFCSIKQDYDFYFNTFKWVIKFSKIAV